MSFPGQVTCETCLEYQVVRGQVVIEAVVQEASKRALDPDYVFDKFMAGVHQRHLDGLPLYDDNTN